MEPLIQAIDQVLPVYLFEKLAPYIVVAFLIGLVTGWMSCNPYEDEDRRP